MTKIAEKGFEAANLENEVEEDSMFDQGHEPEDCDLVS